jgi:hypothetical protein
LQFEISATLTFGSTDSGSGGTAPPAPGNNEVLNLSPSVPVAVSTNRTLSAKLLGDLAGYTQLPVLRSVLRYYCQLPDVFFHSWRTPPLPAALLFAAVMEQTQRCRQGI